MKILFSKILKWFKGLFKYEKFDKIEDSGLAYMKD